MKKIKLNNSNNSYCNNSNSNNINSSNYNSSNSSNNIVDIIPIHEKLFWRIWRFDLLKNHIISFIKSSIYKYKIYKYDEIYSVPWIVSNNHLGLLKDKVLKKQYLVFSDQLYYEEEEDSNESGNGVTDSSIGNSGSIVNGYSGSIGNSNSGNSGSSYNVGYDCLDYRYSIKKKKTFFNLIRNDKEFYYNLFKNYKELFLTDYEFTFNLLLKYDCLVGFIVLKDIYNSNNKINNSYNINNSINNNYSYNSNNYSKSIIESINYSSFNISKYLINNFKFNISGNELWKLVLLDSNETIIEKVRFIKSYLPQSISSIKLINFSLDIKWYKKELRVLLDACYLIDSIKEQLEDQFKMCILSKDQLDSLKFTNEQLETPVYRYSSLDLVIKSLLEMVVPLGKALVKKKNTQFLVLKYTQIQVEDHTLAKLLKVSQLALETLSKFAILPQQHCSIYSLPNLFKYVPSDKEKKVRYIKIYIKRELNYIERNLHYQHTEINGQVFQGLLYIKDKDLFDIILNLNNGTVSLKWLFQVSVCKDLLNYFSINYVNDYSKSVKVFIEREFGEIRAGSLKLDSFQFILENHQDFETILSSVFGCRELLNKIETKNIKFSQFKSFFINSTVDFKFNLEEFYPIQLFKEKYYDSYFWIRESQSINQFNRIISSVSTNTVSTTTPQPERVNLLLDYYLNDGFNCPNDKQLFDDNIILKIGESTGIYNLLILDKIIKHYYNDGNLPNQLNHPTNQQLQQQSSIGNELIYKILFVSSKVGNLEVFKFIQKRYPALLQNTQFDNASKLYINNSYYNGHNQLLDFFFGLGLRKYHSSIIETKYNTITSILLNNNIKKSLFK